MKNSSILVQEQTYINIYFMMDNQALMNLNLSIEIKKKRISIR